MTDTLTPGGDKRQTPARRQGLEMLPLQETSAQPASRNKEPPRLLGADDFPPLSDESPPTVSHPNHDFQPESPSRHPSLFVKGNPPPPRPAPRRPCPRGRVEIDS